MSSQPIVIVGAGQAGLKVAETLRRNGVEGKIVLVGDEPHPPYQRPPLSKKFLLGEVAPSALLLQQPEFFEKNGIELVLGRTVVLVDKSADRITFADGYALDFGKLVFATGSAPRMLPMPGADKRGVHVIRSWNDAQRLHDELPRIENVVIVGAGYVGLEAAASLRSSGKSVTVVEMQDRLLARVACPKISGFLLDAHTAQGVEFLFQTGVTGLEGNPRVRGVTLSSGEQIPADAVIVAIGGVPNQSLAKAAGLPCNDGIVVDSQGRTARANVFATGDCTRFPSRRYGRMLRLESVQNANDQSRAVADTICGKAVDYDPVPWFWSDQYTFKLQMAGLSDGYDETTVEGDPCGGTLAITYMKNGEPIAVATINMARAYMMGRRALEAQANAAA